MRGLDFTSFHSILTGLAGLALITLIGMGMRLVMMITIQQRRERLNRQINERLRTLIAAYKTLGGSFTGDLTVDPRHLRDIRRANEAGETAAATQTAQPAPAAMPESDDPADAQATDESGSDRPRRIRDAVEAALADIILLGTQEQVRLAQRAARELVAGRPVHVHELVISLRDFIRAALDLDPIPTDLDIPPQGPVRPSGAGGGKGGGKNAGGGGQGGKGSGGGKGGDMDGGGMGQGMGQGMGMGLGAGAGVTTGTRLDDSQQSGEDDHI